MLHTVLSDWWQIFAIYNFSTSLEMVNLQWKCNVASIETTTEGTRKISKVTFVSAVIVADFVSLVSGLGENRCSGDARYLRYHPQ